ncbi:MAG: biopolymer transporter ExbD [bacterium]|nr:biopolymer transporter ExbD [bacterium]
MKRLKRAEGAVAEINVTPFVDVLLVLVVVLLVASPILERQIKIDLPKEQLKERSVKADRRLIVTLDDKGRTYLGRKRLKEEELFNQVGLWLAEHPGDRVNLRASRKVRYEQVTHLMARLKQAGAERVGLLVEEE